MFRSLGSKPFARLKLDGGRCVPWPNLFNPCVGRSFSSTVRKYQNATDIDEIFKDEDQKESERQWSTPLAKQLFAAISVSETRYKFMLILTILHRQLDLFRWPVTCACA